MKTLVLGGSLKEERYSNKAIKALRAAGHETLSIGLREGLVADVKIEKERLAFEDVHTVSMYLGAARQEEYYDYILSLKPSRIIFNPGAENPELSLLAEKAGIEVLNACTLVMLSLKNY